MKFAIAFFALLFAGCATQKQYVTSAKPFNRAVKQVCISKDDKFTEPTASQVEANNLALTKIYGSRVKCKSN